MKCIRVPKQIDTGITRRGTLRWIGYNIHAEISGHKLFESLVSPVFDVVQDVLCSTRIGLRAVYEYANTVQLGHIFAAFLCQNYTS